WIARAAARARREIGRARPHVLVSSGPPHSAHLVAWLALRGMKQDVRWLVDLRDPWAGPPAGAWRASAMYRSRAAQWLVPRLEDLMLRGADGVLCNTREFTAALAGRYPGATIHWLPNGVDRDALPAPEPASAPFAGLAIAYLGTLYGGRNLEPVLRALRLFFDRHPAAARDGSRFRVAGHIDQAPGSALPAEVDALGLTHHVEHLGVLPREAALRLAARSRLAVVLAQDQGLQVPAKLYELVALGTPTLVVAEPGSAARSEAERLGAIAAAPDDVPAIAEVLADVWRGALRPGERARNRLDYRDLATELDAILRGKLALI
ncbi:MAG: glycosyltransferase, partial [Gemmatimonadales bacterium]